MVEGLFRAMEVNTVSRGFSFGLEYSGSGFGRAFVKLPNGGRGTLLDLSLAPFLMRTLNSIRACGKNWRMKKCHESNGLDL